MNNNTIVPADLDTSDARAAYIDAFKPIEPGSQRHSELVAHFASGAVGAGIWAETAETLRACVDPVRLGYLYGQIFGVKPPFPLVEAPTWATDHEDFMTTPTDDLFRLWSRTIQEDRFFTATLMRCDYFRFDTGTVVEEETTMEVSIGANNSIDFLTPAQAREAARRLLAAADEWEALTADHSGDLA